MTNRAIFWIGLLIYTFSFCLVAVNPGPKPIFGYSCAFAAFVYPLVQARGTLFGNMPSVFPAILFVPLLISGWINPAFLASACLGFTGVHPRAFRISKIVVVSTLPFSLIFILLYFRTFPREGYFLWIAGMLLVLFSDSFTSTDHS